VAFIDMRMALRAVANHNVGMRESPVQSRLRSASGFAASRRKWLVALSAAAALPLGAAAAGFPPAPLSPDQDIVVHVQKAGGEIIVDVDCPVHAPVPVVWEVLTDYDNMANFISSLQFSGIEHRSDNKLTVRQAGKVSHGLFTYSFDNVREIELVPRAEIRSRLVSGDLKASVYTTRIVDLDGVVHVRNSGRYTPNFWVPPLLGPALVEGETRKNYAELRAEILRRAARHTASAAWGLK
jgi:hypothetical protein